MKTLILFVLALLMGLVFSFVDVIPCDEMDDGPCDCPNYVVAKIEWCDHNPIVIPGAEFCVTSIGPSPYVQEYPTDLNLHRFGRCVLWVLQNQIRTGVRQPYAVVNGAYMNFEQVEAWFEEAAENYYGYGGWQERGDD